MAVEFPGLISASLVISIFQPLQPPPNLFAAPRVEQFSERRPPAPPRSVEKNDTMELSSRHGLGRRTREPCIFFASGLGCWKGSRCDFDHVINQEPGYRPRKDVREKVKEELRSTGWEGPH